MEIEVGEYVRIKNGPIRKIIKINDEISKIVFGKYLLDKAYNYCFSVAENKIKKHSKDIVDLIEIDDIGIIKYKGLILKKFITKDDILELKTKNYELLGLVTSQQFSSVEYLLEEE